MRTLRAALFVTALLVTANIVRADSVPDPKILIAGSGYSQILTSPYFSFTATSDGGGIFDFFNASGEDWTELDLATAMPYGLIEGQWNPLDDPQYYDLGSNLFAFSSLEFGPDDLTMRFWGVDQTHPGIRTVGDGLDPYGSHFSIGLDDSPGVPDVGGWLGSDRSPLTFNATANPAALPVPEPASGVLLLGGALVVGLQAWRRRRA